MKIVVFGASGRIGSIVVRKLLEQGHSVRAFVHSNAILPDHNKLITVKGDIRSAEQVRSAIQGSEVVMCALGSWGTESKDIVSSGMKTILPAMESAGITRIITLTGTEAWLATEPHTTLQKVSHAVFARIARKIIEDGEEHLRLLAASSATWTTIRSPGMRSKGQPATYIVSLQAPKPWVTAHREDVASAMIDQLTSDKYYREAPYIS